MHHGFFWPRERHRITDVKKNRMKLLLANDINFLSYHIPLDMNLTYGSNVQFGKALCLENITHFEDYLWHGSLSKPLSAKDFSQVIEKATSRKPFLTEGGTNLIKNVIWSTGHSQDYFQSACDAGVDAFVSGECSENNFHIAKERGVHFLSAGHYSTEVFGIRSLGDHLASHFNIKVTFVEDFNPI